MCENPECNSDKVFARGFCSGCYTRLRRGGTLARKNIQNTGVCIEPGCGKAFFSRGLCQMHYDRARHPLAGTWALLRSRSPGAYPPEWDRFKAFLEAVGERPGPRHQLRRRNPEHPWSDQNFEWLEPILASDCYTPEQRAEYERAWRFKKKYGITIQDYDRMFEEQGGVCATCRKASVQVHAKSGKLRDLAVDHDHVTGKVRALLCTDCNVVLGLVNDAPALLREMADYLERHQSPRFVPGMTLVATLPEKLGAVTGLRFEGDAVVASSEAGIDFLIPASKLGPSPDRW